MSKKFTIRDYKDAAKRPGQKGYGFPQRREPTAIEALVEAQQEGVSPDAEAEDVTAEVTKRAYEEVSRLASPEEIFSDFAEQEKDMLLDNVEATKVEEEVKVAPVAKVTKPTKATKKKVTKRKVTKKVSRKKYEEPMSHKGSTIDKKGTK